MRNLSRELVEMMKFYARVDPEDGATLRLNNAGITKDEKLELVAGRIYEIQDFVKSFSEHKGKELQNVDMLLDENGKLALQVDGRSFEFKNFELDAQTLRAFLKGEIEPHKHDFRFIYDPIEGTITTKTSSGNVIGGFDSSERYGLSARYISRKRPSFRSSIETAQERPIVERLEVRRYQGKVERLEERKMPDNIHSFTINESLRASLQVDLEPVANDDHASKAERAETREKHIASFQVAAQRRTGDRAAFEVEVDSVEKQSGIKFREGSVYAISGTIDGVGDFRKVYSPSVSERMTMFAPGKLANSVEAGKRYEVNVRKIEELSRNNEHLGVFYEAPYRVHGDDQRVKFDVLLDTFQGRTGVRFKEGKTYEIKGTIGDVTDFTLTHSRGEGNYLYITPPREAAEFIDPGRKYELTVLSVEEKRRFEVSHSGKVTRLTFMAQALESAGIDVEGMKKADEGDRVIEFTLRNLSHEGEQSKTLFAKLNANEGGVMMNIARAGAAQGDMMELEHSRRYRIEDFVENFNAHKGKETQNIMLQLEGKKLAMEVDERKYQFTEYGLDVHTMRVMLKGEVEGFNRGICLIYDADEGTILPTARNNKPIRAFVSSETRGLEARYVLPESTTRVETKPQSFSESRWEMSQFLEKIELQGDSKTIEGIHAFKVDDILHQYIQDRRKMPVNARHEIGDVGEDLGGAIVAKLGWIEVERHPFDLRGPGRECYLHGTDSLFRNPETNEFYLFELRWWQNTDAAMDKAIGEVKERKLGEEMHPKWGKISGAYIAIVDLDKASKVGDLRVKRVW